MVDVSNTVSGPVVATLLAIIAGLGKIIVDLYKIKHRAEDAQDAAQKAVENTKNVSNGFAGSVGSKLDQIIQGQVDVRNRLEKHLEWHLDQTGKEK
jgi:hypothetical protein